MDVELLRAKAYTESVLEAGVWAAGTDTSVRVWDRYEDVLARQLRRDDFHFVALAVTAAERAPMLFAEQIAAGEKVITLSDIDRSGFENIRDAITRRADRPREAARALAPRNPGPAASSEARIARMRCDQGSVASHSACGDAKNDQ